MEYRIFGPPGTGKTTYLVRQIAQAAARYGPANVLVGSFTRAAAAELVGRDLAIPAEQVATLHAHCWRLLGRPMLAEPLIHEWNNMYPDMSLTRAGGMDELQSDEDAPPGSWGDRLMAQAQIDRARMTPSRNESVIGFRKRWDEWKHARGLMDFTDLIETALHDSISAPGSPEVGFFDEVQDFTPLELALLRKWSEHMEFALLAGDDDQCIYAFKGASPDAFLNPALPESQKRVLNQSYRLPEAIRAFADNWIRVIKHREPKEYRAREGEQGAIEWLGNATYKNPEAAIEHAIMCHVEHGRTVMFLGSCAYMLAPLLKRLRAAGIPFHNPYRRKRGDWNPIAPRGPRDGVTTVERVRAFLAPIPRPEFLWTPDELIKWLPLVKSEGVLRRGARAILESHTGTAPFHPATLAGHFERYALERAAEFDMNWLASNAASGKAKMVDYIRAILERGGLETLSQTPRVTVGTIHSVKGGEADAVYLFPDLSANGHMEWTRAAGREAIIRQFYVGMTRARRALIVCGPADSGDVLNAMRAVEPPPPPHGNSLQGE